MRRRFLICLILLLCSFLVIKTLYKEDELRVRIIPNSNDNNDLIIKDEVKEITILFLKENYYNDYNMYINNINKNLEVFNIKLKSYNAYGELTYHQFNNKVYNNKYIKDEEVLTFVVRIGDNNGDNWWGVIYPEFLQLESTDKVIYKSYIYEFIKKYLG